MSGHTPTPARGSYKMSDAQIRAYETLSYEWQPPVLDGRPTSSFSALAQRGLIDRQYVDGLPYYRLFDERPKACAPAGGSGPTLLASNACNSHGELVGLLERIAANARLGAVTRSKWVQIPASDFHAVHAALSKAKAKGEAL